MKKVNIISTVVQRQISGEKIPTGNNVTLNDVVDIDEIRKELSKNFISFDDFKSYWEIKTDAYGNKYLYSPLHIATQNGITMYGQGNTPVKTIMDAIAANLDPNTLAVQNGLLTVVGGTGSIASITKKMVIDALGFTPYDASNPNGYITSASLSGLNADTLDGKHDGELTALFVAKQNATTDDFSNYLKTYGNKGFSIVENSSGGDIGNIGAIYTAVNFGSQLSRLGRFIFCRNDNSNELYFQAPKSDLSDWGLKNRIAFVNSNVESATKLETPRTIWGQSFDGSKNVDGKLFVTISTKANSNSDAAIGVKSTYAENSFCRPLSFLFPNALAGAAPHVYMGVEDSQYNGGYFGFKYKGKGDASNYITLGLYSADNIIVANGYGNVGIGTLNPSYKLHVNGDFKLDGNCLASFFGKSITDVWSDGTNSHTWYGYDHRYPNTGVYSTTISDYFGMMFRTVDTTLCLTKSGCVGINTDSPSSSLHVAGNILATGGITMYSQRSLKNIVDERSLSLLELSTIKPTRYTWKDGRDNNIHIGGIADDVKQVLPEVVYKTADGTLTMDYGNAGFAIAASLIKPVIDHDQRIKALERENVLLKQELNRLRA